MSMLSIIQDSTDRIGIPRPASVVGSTDTQVRQLFSLLNEEGEELSKRGPWQSLTAEWTFTTTASTVQTNTPFPADMREMIPDSIFNRTQVRKVIGPINPQEWQAMQAQPAYGRVYLAFRQRRGQALFIPVPPADELIAYEYISKYWAQSSTGVSKEAFTADDDTSYLEDALLKLGLRWRWKHAKGLDYAEDLETYEKAVTEALGSDGGARALDITGADQRYYFGANLPDGGFGFPS